MNPDVWITQSPRPAQQHRSWLRAAAPRWFAILLVTKGAVLDDSSVVFTDKSAQEIHKLGGSTLVSDRMPQGSLAELHGDDQIRSRARCGVRSIQSSGAKDAGSNKVLADVCPWLKDQITARIKQLSKPLTIKYTDPTYMICSVPANSFDGAYGAVLGRMAVHAAMAGYSGVTVGKVYERYVYLSIHAITMQKGRRVNPNGRWFSRMVATTKQPSCTPEGIPKSISDDPLRPRSFRAAKPSMFWRLRRRLAASMTCCNLATL